MKIALHASITPRASWIGAYYNAFDMPAQLRNWGRLSFVRFLNRERVWMEIDDAPRSDNLKEMAIECVHSMNAGLESIDPTKYESLKSSLGENHEIIINGHLEAMKDHGYAKAFKSAVRLKRLTT